MQETLKHSQDAPSPLPLNTGKAVSYRFWRNSICPWSIYLLWTQTSAFFLLWFGAERCRKGRTWNTDSKFHTPAALLSSWG